MQGIHSKTKSVNKYGLFLRVSNYCDRLIQIIKVDWSNRNQNISTRNGQDHSNLTYSKFEKKKKRRRKNQGKILSGRKLRSQERWARTLHPCMIYRGEDLWIINRDCSRPFADKIKQWLFISRRTANPMPTTENAENQNDWWHKKDALFLSH